MFPLPSYREQIQRYMQNLCTIFVIGNCNRTLVPSCSWNRQTIENLPHKLHHSKTMTWWNCWLSAYAIANNPPPPPHTHTFTLAQEMWICHSASIVATIWWKAYQGAICISTSYPCWQIYPTSSFHWPPPPPSCAPKKKTRGGKNVHGTGSCSLWVALSTVLICQNIWFHCLFIIFIVLKAYWWWCRTSCPGCQLTNCDQCLSMVQCCFTSTETVRLIRVWKPKTATSTFTQLLNPEPFMLVECCFTSTETIRLIRQEGPGQPPWLSHGSWTLKKKSLLFSLALI